MKPTVNQLRRLVGNPDAYAIQNYHGAWLPFQEDLNERVLASHIDQSNTIGTYILWGDKARTLVFDIDDEGEDTYAQAEGIRDELVRLGVPARSIGIEFSGKKGHHVWVVAADYIQAKELRRLGRAVLALLDFKCEVFPKQDEAKKLGNLVKLPGGIHQVSKKENNFVDRVPMPMSVQVLKRVLADLPPEPEKPKYFDAPDGVIPCMATIAEGVGNGNRNNALYHYAVLLRGTNRLTDESVDTLVRKAAAACVPPYGETAEEAAELEGLLESSKTGGPLCSQLPEGMRCGEGECVRNSRKGKPLEARPGQLNMAGEGEGVVLEVEERRGDILVLKHPDLKGGGKISVGRG